MLRDDAVYIGTGNLEDATSAGIAQYLNLDMANRHGLIAGATGTGKTITSQILAQGFAGAGVPVFMADVKGDVAGMAVAGTKKDFLFERARKIGLGDGFRLRAYPVTFWDIFAEQGHPVRASVSDMGPLLLSRLMDLSEAQEGVVNVAFRIADDEGLLLLDLKDLRAILARMMQLRDTDISQRYGYVSRRSIGAVQRHLLVLEEQGGERLFGEPALDIADLMCRAEDGRGMINILAADALLRSPRVYSMFLLWLLSELFEELPEVGDGDKPRLVFFFDEAHLLFDDAPKVLVEKIEQVVKLIRSKGVGVYFVTQNPIDIPDTVLSQLGSRIQHALRAYTPRERKAVRVAAQTFRPNSKFDTLEAITTLGIGEALVSTLQKSGVPSIVQRTLIRPPETRMGPLTRRERAAILQASPMGDRYDQPIDRISAYEVLGQRARERQALEQKQRQAEDRARGRGRRVARSRKGYSVPGMRDDTPTARARRRASGRQRQSVAEAAMKSLARSVASSLGRTLVRGILGSLKRGF